MKKLLKIVLILLSIASIFLGVYILSIHSNDDSLVGFEELYYGSYGLGYMLLVALIPLTIAIASFILIKRKKWRYTAVMVVGIIFAFIEAMFGMLSFITRAQYSTDNTHLEDIEKKLGIEFNNAKILYQDNNQANGGIKHIACGTIRMDMVDNSFFTSDKFKNKFSDDVNAILPEYERLLYVDFEYVSIINLTTGKYFDITSPTDTGFIAIGYDRDKNVFYFKEFNKVD